MKSQYSDYELPLTHTSIVTRSDFALCVGTGPQSDVLAHKLCRLWVTLREIISLLLECSPNGNKECSS